MGAEKLGPTGREINRIVIHCTATSPEQDIDITDVRRWHVEENKWNDVGYHYLILRDGSVQEGRPEELAGAHARGHNHDSLGIALVGGVTASGGAEFNYTAAQMGSLDALVLRLMTLHEITWVGGHRDLDSGKECPCFDVGAYFEGFLDQ